MKSKLLLVCIALLHFNAYSGIGIKTKSADVQFYRHDAKKGLALLEQTSGNKLQVTWNNENSTPVFVTGKLTKPGWSKSSKELEGKRFLSENSELFGLKDANNELLLNSTFTDELNMTHVKYDQSLNGIRIFPSQVIVHFNNDGSVESVNGNYIPTPLINTVPETDAQTAISNAKRLINYKTDKEESSLIIFRSGLKLTLAYEVRLPGSYYPEMKVFINAKDGSVIKKDDGLRYDGPVTGTGIGLKGTTRSIHTYLSGGTYYLIDATLPMYVPPVNNFTGVINTYNAKNDTAGDGYGKATLVTDPNNDNNFNDSTSLRAAVDAHYWTEKVYNFYKSHFGRNSFDDKGSTLTSIVHYKYKFQNAFWNGAGMTYGDGDGVDLADFASSLDVIAHEITHGVTQYTSQLVYELQPGAINEHMSDVVGVLADSSNWLMGEDVLTPAIPGDAIRNMQDPHNGYSPGDILWQPANMSEYVTLPDNEANDWGGVHINSGIPNKAFYNVASVIGRYKAGKIWYRAETTYLNSNSQFSELRIACENSAKDLFGQSTELSTVSSGFENVGIIDNSSTEIAYDDGTPESYVYMTSSDTRLAGKISPPIGTCEVKEIRINIAGDANNGTAHFTLEMFSSGNTGLPSTSLINPYSYTPSAVGWQAFTISNLSVTKDFFISVRYDGTNYAAIAADNPPGLGRSYLYDPQSSSWSNLTGSYDYVLYMRATVKTVTGIAEIDNRIPESFEVSQNYPNPFNPSTTIRYSLPEETYVSIKIFDVNGNYVADLADNHQNPGTYSITWNGKNNNGQSVASGVYYFNIKAGNFVKTTKMMLLK